MKNIYITAAEPYTGKSLLALGMMQTLLQGTGKTAFFRPIAQNTPDGRPDTDINLILSYFELDITYEAAHGVSEQRAHALLNSNRRAALVEEILLKYKRLEAEHDFILCEGTDFLGRDAAFEFELNIEIALNLGGSVLTVISGKDRRSDDITDFSRLTLNLLRERGLDNHGLIINRCNLGAGERKNLLQRIRRENEGGVAVFVVPENPILGRPHLGDVLRQTEAALLSGHQCHEVLVEDVILAAGGAESFIRDLKPGGLVLTPADRTDIILAALASRHSSACPDIAGLLVCGRPALSPRLKQMLNGFSVLPLPVMATQLDVMSAAVRLASLHSKLSPQDSRKIAAALGLFERHVKINRLSKRLIKAKSHKISPKMLELRLIDYARRKKMHIVLPEGDEERTLQAVEILLARNAVNITLLGDEQRIRNVAGRLDLNIEGAKIINPQTASNRDAYADAYYALRKHKGITPEQAREIMLDPIYYGTMMLHRREADGLVSGAVHTTANTIRPAFEIIKTRPGVETASSIFLMCMQNQVFAFGDCAVVVDPTAEQLAGIALSSVETARLFGIEPRVAMLSYSTGTSGHGADVDKVAAATEIVRKRAPGLPLEGPIQYDAAVDPDTARIKLPGSPVAGKATVFIFPDLNTGNNTYKAVQRAAGAVAIGPILQGLNLPVNDLSRGATVADIVNTIAITAIQAQALKQAHAE